MSGRIHIGTSGWSYAGWRGLIYPRDVPEWQWLGWYATHFDCVELNNTFYRLAKPGMAQGWADAVPGSFRFAVKGSRYLTHMRRLRDVERGPRRFFASIEALGRKRGPVLWQLPPQMKRDAARLEAFLFALPRGRHAVEFRNREWLHPSVYEVLHRHGAALVVHDLLDVRWPSPLPGPFVYRRFHGTTSAYSGSYSPAQLRAAARWLQKQEREAWVFFNNDQGGHAFRNALALKQLLEPRLTPSPERVRRPSAPLPPTSGSSAPG